MSVIVFIVIPAALLALSLLKMSISNDRNRRHVSRTRPRKYEDIYVGGDNHAEVSPTYFLAKRKNMDEFTGVYILHNRTKDKYYVGQAVRVLKRVTDHFTGHGNGDVYADYKYHDEFTIRTMSLRESGYDSLDKLESDMIRAYDAYKHGYNKTRGNSN